MSTRAFLSLHSIGAKRNYEFPSSQKKVITHRINSQLYGRPPPGILNFENIECEKREIRERILANWAEKFPSELASLKDQTDFMLWRSSASAPTSQDFYESSTLCNFLYFIAFFYFHDRRGFDEMHFFISFRV